MESVLNRFTTKQVLLIAVTIVLGMGAIWGLAHWTATPGTEVNVGWVSYTKNGNPKTLHKNTNESIPVTDGTKPLLEIDNPEALKIQIAELQDQLKGAYELQSKQQIETLDPRSELPNLISELESRDASIQEQAVQGLFVIRNPVSYQALKKHFHSNIGEADYFVSGKSIEKWIELLFELNEMESVRLAAEIAGSEEVSKDARKEARSALMFETHSSDAIDIAIGVFQQLALTSKNTLIRTNTKSDLQWLIQKREREESSEK